MLLHKKEFFGNGFFTADHVTVCGLLVLFLCYFGLYIRTHVETVVLLSQQNPDEHIRIKIDLDELDETSAETKATYDKIRDWVGDNYQLHVTNLNIA
jgi:23S rRNA (uracil1939-C5)-methyltransferase